MIATLRVVVVRVKVEIWSDVACPWCYIGKRRFEAALAGFAHSDEVEVTWRSFELNPDTPRDFEGSVADYLGQIKGMAPAQVEAMLARVTEIAAGEGLEYHFDQVRHGNTFDAHRLIHFAASVGSADAMKERLLRAYFVDGEPVSDHETLVRLAAEVGLDPGATRSVLAGGDFADEVQADKARARSFGINGVPFFVVDEKFGVSGAQETAVFERALDQAWAETHPLTVVGADAADATCEDGSCAV